MNSKIIQNINKRSGISNLSNILVEKIKLSELKSLLMDVYRQKMSALNVTEVFRDYKNNRFVKPSSVNLKEFLSFDLKAFSFLPPAFKTIALSPLAPLGSCSVLAGVPQNNIVTTTRNTELMADATNVLAMECAARREKLLKADSKSTECIKLCTSQRHTRTQSVENKNFTAHFTIMALCSAGRDEGNLIFEKESLQEHISFYFNVFENIADAHWIRKISVNLYDYGEPGNDDITDVIEKLLKDEEKGEVIIYKNSELGKHYYSRMRFSIFVTNEKNETHMHVDGGFTNWTAKLLKNNKERILTSGMGTEYMLKTLKMK